MKINAPSFGLAGAASVCIIYAIFAFILKYWPEQTLKFIGTIHMLPKLDYLKSFIKVTPQAIAMGIITHTALAFFIFFFIALIYNLIQRIFTK
ncbi:MAG TPA: DUF5676 family membrane protein [Candidatus Babeliales bacterium]|jgi:hypothetical protein|nr:DUF5676 family membrane protein [Candidatus Babeliales bacterium]